MAWCASTDAQTFNSTDTPRSIVDGGTIFSSISVGPGVGSITDVNVLIDITHIFDADLDISLISPAGTTVDLTSDNGSSGDNYTNTVFDDEATTSITAGSPPFTGSFQPESPLSALDGQDPNGFWSLSVGDDTVGNSGTLNSWQLSLAQVQSQAVPTPSADLHASLPAIQLQNNLSFLLVLHRYAESQFGNDAYEYERPFDPEDARFFMEGTRPSRDVVRGQNAPALPLCCPSNALVTGYGQSGDINGFAGTNGLNYDLAGTAFGLDWWLDDCTLWGISGGFAKTNVTTDAGTGFTDLDGYQVAAYGCRACCDNYWIGIMSYGHSEYSTRRIVNGFGVARADYEGDAFATYLEHGHSFSWGCCQLSPLVGLQYIYLRQAAFAETGAGLANLSVPAQRENSLRASAGLRTTRVQRVCQHMLLQPLLRQGVLVSELRARYIHEMFDDTFGSTATLTGGTNVNLRGASTGEEFGNFGGGLSWIVNDRLQISANYDYQVGAHRFGAHRFGAHTGQGALAYAW